MVLAGKVSPPTARRRGQGVIRAGSVAIRGFADAGWGWGGRWSSPRDPQHFSLSGH